MDNMPIMAEFAAKLALVLCMACAVLTLVFLIKYLLRYFKSIEQRSRNTQIEVSCRLLDSLIKATAVCSLNRDEAAKECAEGTFQSEKEEMLEVMLEDVLKTVNPGSQAHIKGYIGDLDEWITDRLEYYRCRNRQKL
jgi:hypothetical protein